MCNLKVGAISAVTWRTVLHVPGTPFGGGSIGGYTITLTLGPNATLHISKVVTF